VASFVLAILVSKLFTLGSLSSAMLVFPAGLIVSPAVMSSRRTRSRPASQASSRPSGSRGCGGARTSARPRSC